MLKEADELTRALTGYVIERSVGCSLALVYAYERPYHAKYAPVHMSVRVCAHHVRREGSICPDRTSARMSHKNAFLNLRVSVCADMCNEMRMVYQSYF